MWTALAGNDNSDLGHVEQRQIIGGIPQSENPDIRDTLSLFQSRQSPTFADAITKQMSHSVALNNGELPINGESPQPGAGRR